MMRGKPRTLDLRLKTSITAFVVCGLLSGICGLTPSHADDWPQFRGVNSQGISTETNLPTEWSETKNIVWKVDLPGKGSSSPVVSGRKLFVTAFTGYGLDVKAPGNPEDLVRHLICLDRDTGRVLWKKNVPNRGVVRKCESWMGSHGYASHTPVTDGKAIYCWFASHGAVAFDLAGNLLWQTEPFEMTPTPFGSGASPTLYQDLLIINASLEGNIVVALDKKTGRKVWRREDVGSYTTPVIAKTSSGPEMILNHKDRLAAFDPSTGKDLWQNSHPGSGYVIPTPLVHDSTVYAYSGSDTGIVAVRIGGRGDVSSTHRVWTYRVNNSVPSPVYANGYVYSSQGVLHCVRATDGKLMYKERIPDVAPVYASPLAADGKIYIIGRFGHSVVVKAGPAFEVIAQNKIEDDDSYFNASPAVSDGKIFIRSQKKLYCIGKGADE